MHIRSPSRGSRRVPSACATARNPVSTRTDAAPTAGPLRAIRVDADDPGATARALGSLLAPRELLSRFAWVAADTEPPIGPGLNSFAQITGGSLVYDDSAPLPELRGFVSSASSGELSSVSMAMASLHTGKVARRTRRFSARLMILDCRASRRVRPIGNCRSTPTRRQYSPANRLRPFHVVGSCRTCGHTWSRNCWSTYIPMFALLRAACSTGIAFADLLSCNGDTTSKILTIHRSGRRSTASRHAGSLSLRFDSRASPLQALASAASNSGPDTATAWSSAFFSKCP